MDNCGHRFCRDCISHWVRKEEKKTCPVCRVRIHRVQIADASGYETIELGPDDDGDGEKAEPVQPPVEQPVPTGPVLDNAQGRRVMHLFCRLQSDKKRLSYMKKILKHWCLRFFQVEKMLLRFRTNNWRLHALKSCRMCGVSPAQAVRIMSCFSSDQMRIRAFHALDVPTVTMPSQAAPIMHAFMTQKGCVSFLQSFTS